MANFDFIETATLVACINKFLHTRSLAVFNSQFSTFNSQLKTGIVERMHTANAV